MCAISGEWFGEWFVLLRPLALPPLLLPCVGYRRLGRCTGDVGRLGLRKLMPRNGPRTGLVDGVYSNGMVLLLPCAPLPWLACIVLLLLLAVTAVDVCVVAGGFELEPLPPVSGFPFPWLKLGSVMPWAPLP